MSLSNQFSRLTLLILSKFLQMLFLIRGRGNMPLPFRLSVFVPFILERFGAFSSPALSLVQDIPSFRTLRRPSRARATPMPPSRPRSFTTSVASSSMGQQGSFSWLGVLSSSQVNSLQRRMVFPRSRPIRGPLVVCLRGWGFFLKGGSQPRPPESPANLKLRGWSGRPREPLLPREISAATSRWISCCASSCSVLLRPNRLRPL